MSLARAAGDDANVIFSRYAAERLLYRLAQSRQADQFVLKGAVKFLVWTKNMYRPTMDLDLLGFGEDSVTRLEEVFRDCCDLRTEPDGLIFDAGRVKATLIREGQEYQGNGMPSRAMAIRAAVIRPRHAMSVRWATSASKRELANAPKAAMSATLTP